MEQPKLAYQLWPQTRDDLFRDHPQSPLDPAAHEHMLRWPALRGSSAVSAASSPRTESAAMGAVCLLPFEDATSGRQIYGGGRCPLDTIKSADLGVAPDGRLILDFNYTYQPSCAHSDRWV